MAILFLFNYSVKLSDFGKSYFKKQNKVLFCKSMYIYARKSYFKYAVYLQINVLLNNDNFIHVCLAKD